MQDGWPCVSGRPTLSPRVYIVVLLLFVQDVCVRSANPVPPCIHRCSVAVCPGRVCPVTQPCPPMYTSLLCCCLSRTCVSGRPTLSPHVYIVVVLLFVQDVCFRSANPVPPCIHRCCVAVCPGRVCPVGQPCPPMYTSLLCCCLSRTCVSGRPTLSPHVYIVVVLRFVQDVCVRSANPVPPCVHRCCVAVCPGRVCPVGQPCPPMYTSLLCCGLSRTCVSGRPTLSPHVYIVVVLRFVQDVCVRSANPVPPCIHRCCVAVCPGRRAEERGEFLLPGRLIDDDSRSSPCPLFCPPLDGDRSVISHCLLWC